MNKTISIYELLGLIKDGKAPKKIKYDNIIYNYENDNELIGYVNKDLLVERWLTHKINFDEKEYLNKKVEILQEDKPTIEKIKRHEIKENGFTISEQPSINEIIEKVNEIIDYLNRKENNDKH